MIRAASNPVVSARIALLTSIPHEPSRPKWGYGMIGAKENASDMADVFVSYRRDDREIARQFATGLER